MAATKRTGAALRRRLVTTLMLMGRLADAHAEEARLATARANALVATEADEKRRAHAHAGAALALLHARHLLKRTSGERPGRLPS